MSVGPPGGNGSMRRMVFVGYACARTAGDDANAANAATAQAKPGDLLIIFSSLGTVMSRCLAVRLNRIESRMEQHFASGRRLHEVDERPIALALRRAGKYGGAIHDRLPKLRRERSDDDDTRNGQELGGLLHADIGLAAHQYRADHLAGTRLDELCRDRVRDAEPFAGLLEVYPARAAAVADGLRRE